MKHYSAAVLVGVCLWASLVLTMMVIAIIDGGTTNTYSRYLYNTLKYVVNPPLIVLVVGYVILEIILPRRKS